MDQHEQLRRIVARDQYLSKCVDNIIDAVLSPEHETREISDHLARHYWKMARHHEITLRLEAPRA